MIGADLSSIILTYSTLAIKVCRSDVRVASPHALYNSDLPFHTQKWMITEDRTCICHPVTTGSVYSIVEADRA